MNWADEAPRVNATQRPPIAPPEVIKLGHVVLEVADYQATCAWYTQHFGFIPSDVQVLPDGSPAVTFLRLDLGNTPAVARRSYVDPRVLDEFAVGRTIAPSLSRLTKADRTRLELGELVRVRDRDALERAVMRLVKGAS